MKNKAEVIYNICLAIKGIGDAFNHEHDFHCICGQCEKRQSPNFNFDEKILIFIIEAIDEKIVRDGLTVETPELDTFEKYKKYMQASGRIDAPK